MAMREESVNKNINDIFKRVQKINSQITTDLYTECNYKNCDLIICMTIILW